MTNNQDDEENEDLNEFHFPQESISMNMPKIKQNTSSRNKAFNSQGILGSQMTESNMPLNPQNTIMRNNESPMTTSDTQTFGEMSSMQTQSRDYSYGKLNKNNIKKSQGVFQSMQSIKEQNTDDTDHSNELCPLPEFRIEMNKKLKTKLGQQGNNNFAAN